MFVRPHQYTYFDKFFLLQSSQLNPNDACGSKHVLYVSLTVFGFILTLVQLFREKYYKTLFAITVKVIIILVIRGMLWTCMVKSDISQIVYDQMCYLCIKLFFVHFKNSICNLVTQVVPKNQLKLALGIRK